MADIFISYSKQDRDVTEALADYLTTEGYVVWWDTSLVSGESFRTAIDEQLDAARAIIVIWSKNSIASDWVISEAEHGARRGNLIPVKIADVGIAEIPKPYNTRHTDDVDNYVAVRAALKRLAVEPLYKEDEAGLSPHDRYWATIENSEHPEDFEAYVKEFPDGAHVPLARLTISRLKRRAADPKPQHAVSSGGASGSSVLATLLTILLATSGAAGGSYLFLHNYVRPETTSTNAGLLQATAFAKSRQEEVLKKLAVLEKWDAAGVIPSIEALEKNQRQIIEANSSIADKIGDLQKVDSDDQAWRAALDGNTIKDWNKYLLGFPQGKHASDAKLAIEVREIRRIIPESLWSNKIRNTVSGLSDFRIGDGGVTQKAIAAKLPSYLNTGNAQHVSVLRATEDLGGHIRKGLSLGEPLSNVNVNELFDSPLKLPGMQITRNSNKDTGSVVLVATSDSSGSTRNVIWDSAYAPSLFAILEDGPFVVIGDSERTEIYRGWQKLVDYAGGVERVEISDDGRLAFGRISEDHTIVWDLGVKPQ